MATHFLFYFFTMPVLAQEGPLQIGEEIPATYETKHPYEIIADLGAKVPAGTIPKFDLTVTSSGAGIGTFNSTPDGMDCGSDCSQTYDYNTAVTLTVTPSSPCHSRSR